MPEEAGNCKPCPCTIQDAPPQAQRRSGCSAQREQRGARIFPRGNSGRREATVRSNSSRAVRSSKVRNGGAAEVRSAAVAAATQAKHSRHGAAGQWPSPLPALPACVSAVRDAFISGLPASCCAFPLPPGFSRRAARCLLTGNSPWGTIRMLSRPAPRRPRHHAPPTENGSRPWSAADAARRLSVPRRLESSTPSAPAPVAQLNRAVAS